VRVLHRFKHGTLHLGCFFTSQNKCCVVSLRQRAVFFATSACSPRCQLFRFCRMSRPQQVVARVADAQLGLAALCVLTPPLH
jgi:hypothetical protein